MRVLGPDQVHARMTKSLGLDESLLDLTTIEGIAAALRRAAGFLCPCPPAMLIDAVLLPLRGLSEEPEVIKGAIEDTLEALIGYGDLFESHDVATTDPTLKGNLLYLSPPRFVMRNSGASVLVGITPDHISPLPSELTEQIEYTHHVRRLPPQSTDLRLLLIELGLAEISATAWMKMPKQESPEEHITRLRSLLKIAPRSGEVPGIKVLDPNRAVTYYRGRWRETINDTGYFVGRRAQAYGADLWCYMEIVNGHPARFIDLPLKGSRFRGCDEAWRLQAAIDHNNGNHQVLRMRSDGHGRTVFDLFSPLPMWARRRWDAIGEPVGSNGCLFSYRFDDAEVDEELGFAQHQLWLKTIWERKEWS